jgi:hypothetical protein
MYTVNWKYHLDRICKKMFTKSWNMTNRILKSVPVFCLHFDVTFL